MSSFVSLGYILLLNEMFYIRDQERFELQNEQRKLPTS